ncbi:acyl-CoA dehydrogenase family protein [Halocalculus aciditolerans]|uniref:Acyl-CoA dehydrogenase n=1 Tax=Halocalculus aciditolerans TaxID=1383812 RepID=A0A830F9D8_9EURY|nr:acyl-CoA dehydrogenase family protein [Halocalculus aciditolerans]GGL67437.1 acyl-CoA dehydrogenase [Halocalculus aciditolerans]
MIALDDEQRMVLDAIQQVAESEFAEKAFTWQGETPWENVELLAEQGFLGINIAEEYGGGGMSELEAMLTIEAVGEVCPDTAQFLYEQQMVAPRAVEMFGSDAVKDEYLPRVTGGETMIAVAISEPEAGSDVGSMTTEVTEEDGELVLNGEKTWVSSVPESAAAVVWTKFPEGLGTVLLDFEMDGVEVAEHYTNMSGATQTQFYMEDVTIPEENVLTRGPEAFKAQLKALNWERLGSATLGNAVARCAVDKALTYAEDREQFGQPIGEFQGMEWKFADMVKRLEASRALTYRAATTAVEQGRIPDRMETSIAKLYSAEMVEDVVSEALQVHGSNGYQQGHPLEYLYRMQRGRRIAAGTDEVQKNQIASVLQKQGLPDLA